MASLLLPILILSNTPWAADLCFHTGAIQCRFQISLSRKVGILENSMESLHNTNMSEKNFT